MAFGQHDGLSAILPFPKLNNEAEIGAVTRISSSELFSGLRRSPRLHVFDHMQISLWRDCQQYSLGIFREHLSSLSNTQHLSNRRRVHLLPLLSTLASTDFFGIKNFLKDKLYCTGRFSFHLAWKKHWVNLRINKKNFNFWKTAKQGLECCFWSVKELDGFETIVPLGYLKIYKTVYESWKLIVRNCPIGKMYWLENKQMIRDNLKAGCSEPERTKDALKERKTHQYNGATLFEYRRN